jgi:hypothetical protein
MKRFDGVILILFFFLGCLLPGCTQTPPETQNHDNRLIGNWQDEKTKEVLTFDSNGIYSITEAETANWSTLEGGKLWMDGILYSYVLSQNDTSLSITQEGYTRTYQKI